MNDCAGAAVNEKLKDTQNMLNGKKLKSQNNNEKYNSILTHTHTHTKLHKVYFLSGEA